MCRILMSLLYSRQQLFLVASSLLLVLNAPEAVLFSGSAKLYKVSTQFMSQEKSPQSYFLSIMIGNDSNSHLRVRRAAGSDGSIGSDRLPQLTFSVKDIFNRTLTPNDGQFIRLNFGDRVRFVISLTRDDVYDSFQVQQCLMSSSSQSVDSSAETRVLIANGCPLLDEATASSWYWTNEASTGTSFISNTQPVTVFRLYSSSYIYLHCTIKLCFVGANPCQQKTRADCITVSSKRKKRQTLVDGNANANETLALHIVDSTQETDSTTVTVFIVLLALIGLTLLVIVIVLLVILVRKRNQHKTMRPQEFMEQRIIPRKNKICSCC